MKIHVEGIAGRLPAKDVEITVLPRIGEVIELDDETYEVLNVIHDVENDVVRLEVE